VTSHHSHLFHAHYVNVTDTFVHGMYSVTLITVK